MTETCFNCKYSSVHNGMQSCVWKSGLVSQYARCEEFERDWGKTISAFLCFAMIFIFPIILLISIVIMKVI